LGNHLSGRIESFDLIDLIQWLEVRRVSGRLILSKGEDRKTIDWKEGDIVYVSGGRPGDRLGFSLLRSQAVPVSGLYSALGENLATGEKLTRILLARDLISRERLATVIESLARRLLREALTWRRGRFEFDPDFQTEDVLQIHLKIKSQVVAFEAVKEMDDTARAARVPAEEKEGDGWERRFRPEALEESFWEVRGRVEEDGDVAKEKERFFRFRQFGNALRARLSAPLSFLPIFEDSARYSDDLLQTADGPETDERLLGLVHLDPFFTLNLLLLANSLTVGGIRRVATAREAHRRIGAAAFRSFVECLAAPRSSKLSSSDPVARILRRAAVAAALAGSHVGPRLGVDADEAYGAALLHAIPYADLLGAVEAAPMPSGAFRAAALEYFRPVVATIRSESWRLPAGLTAVLSDAGEKNPPPLVAAVREARRAIPACSIGPVPASARKGAESRSEIRSAVKKTFAFLSLGEL
jgi:Domain of unknown function (DUF4388)/HDOD domain